MSTNSSTKKSVKNHRSSVKPHILWFEGKLLSATTITAFLENTSKYSDDNIEQTIDVEEFKAWAQQEEEFNWCMDYHDPSHPDGHGQVTGTMTWEEYCTNVTPHIICRDLENFLHHKNSIACQQQ